MRLFTVLFFMSYSLPGMAGARVEVGGVLGHFEYEERSDSGATFNQESGTLPGIQAELAFDVSDLGWIKLSGSRLFDDVRYRGMTQSGRPLKTRTDTEQTFFELTLGRPEISFHNYRFTPMVRAGLRKWQRDILPTSNTLRLNEAYRWRELGLGGSVCKNVALGWVDAWCLEGWALYTLEASVKVDLTEINAGSPSIRLGSKPGASFQAAAFMGPVEFKVFSHFWQFGKSDTKIVNRAGGGRLQVQEPASQSWLTGFAVGLRF
ncbi:hypothetical protein [Marinobacter sp. S6332]|uniref:hypothetical protein n=1 Tax=Marinobacter sp. S6332 TaxID=2926403 RepID=UPI001FF28D20|nr:hypothetical protein [Marinobacter sp. S6332]MCK0163710.1 hypothetical protein [Marinobacter sp. S6332]